MDKSTHSFPNPAIRPIPLVHASTARDRPIENSSPNRPKALSATPLKKPVTAPRNRRHADPRIERFPATAKTKAGGHRRRSPSGRRTKIPTRNERRLELAIKRERLAARRAAGKVFIDAPALFTGELAVLVQRQKIFKFFTAHGCSRCLYVSTN